jgi:hypothetical protein
MMRILAILLLSSTVAVAAQTTTTTTSTTTTTTLLPHPFSTATASCLRAAKATRRTCHQTGGTSCFPTYQTDYAKCFAAGAGAKCATKCITTEGTCFGKLPTTKKTCRKACATAKKADVKACRGIAVGDTIWAGGDASCLGTAQSNFDLCRAICAGLAIDCRTALKFCIANCPNL